MGAIVQTVAPLEIASTVGGAHLWRHKTWLLLFCVLSRTAPSGATERGYYSFANDVMINELRKVIKTVKQTYPFAIEAWVLLPDHMHCMWTLPDGDDDYSKRIGMIKARFTSRVKTQFQKPEWITSSRVRHGESAIWQRRFWEHEIKDERDSERHVDYIHYNPVKHGLVKRVCDWPYSIIVMWKKVYIRKTGAEDSTKSW